MVTDPQTNKQTHKQDRLQYTASQLARNVKKGNHWRGMSQSLTPMQSHTSLTRCPPQGRQLIKRHNTRFPSIPSWQAHMFYPIAIETAGTWDDMAIELVQEIGRRTSHHPGHQRNSLSVSTSVHSSAAGECGLFPQHNQLRIRSSCSRCLTFCLVFTPAALCWWAK